MMCNKPKLGLVNMNAYTCIKFGEMLSICLMILSGNGSMMDGMMDGRNDRQPKSNIALTFSKWSYNYRKMTMKWSFFR